MEERKTDREQEWENLSQKSYDPSLEEEQDEIPEQEREQDELQKEESVRIQEKKSIESEHFILENGCSNQKSKKKFFLMQRIRIAAGVVLIAVVVGIVWFNIHYKKADLLYQTSSTTKPVQTTPEETKDPILLKEDVFQHYENLAVVDDKVDKYLNIRQKPSNEAQIIGKYLPYSYVHIVREVEDGWYEVQIEEEIGYVSKEHVQTGEEARQLALEHCLHKVEVSKDHVKGYDGNHDKANELVELVNGDRYDVVKDRENGWILIHARHNTECYVKAEDVTDGYYLNEGILFTGDGEISQTRLDFLNNAWQYLRGKYVWGGEELGVGVDCSGFIWKLLQQYDIHIHRVSIEQSQDGVEVKPEDMRPGDLIFYINRGDQISHVAIYTGSKTILHAASEEKGICLDPWDYLKPEAIRNIFGDENV